MTDTLISLDDKYSLASTRALTTGRQALIRMLLAQRALDRARGLKTAGFVSGYRGSPLGGLDLELGKAAKVLAASDISFEPGINEDLALTALAGTQQLDFLPGRTVDGVFALWYGKGPGVDRSGDAIKHANLAGVSAHGGLVLAFGDDHAGKSSTTAHQSDLTLASWDVPVLYPATVDEIVEYGLAAFAMSRFTGGLVGLKLVNETAEGTAVLSENDAAQFVTPEITDDGVNVHIRFEVRAMLDQDARLVRHKLPRARAFARANCLDRITFGARAPKLLIATAGKAYGDTIAALELLGLDNETAARFGVGVYKIALLFPLDPEALREAARDAAEIVFVEEKRPNAETQAKAIFYGASAPPVITGKFDPDGAPLLPGDFPLDARLAASALAARIDALIPGIGREVLQFARTRAALREGVKITAPPAVRRPAFCPGCPHNTSTKLPDGAYAMTGIGCHGMVMFHADRRPLPMGQMGAEGANWIGLSRYNSTQHVFQNLGDGTYSHSGSLAIRAAHAAGVNITYKILYNDAVAMTGGQPVEGSLTVAAIAAQVLAEGVREVVVLAEDPARFTGAEKLPTGVVLRHRDDLAPVQERLAQIKGVSVLIYDQICAAEKRRRRKAKIYPDPDRRIFINTEVCEGCGDCSVQSNCLAIQPLDTELGRKRRIDQSACNKDFSCTKGFCPSFVIVEGARPRRRRVEAQSPADDIAVPALAPRGFDLMLAGIGGTGVTTVGAILGMAARIDGLVAHLYDMTGLSQKGGAVFSHVRLRRFEDPVPPARIGPQEADTILACDLVAGVHPEVTAAIVGGHTLIVANSDITATADFQVQRDLAVSRETLIAPLTELAQERPALINATAMSERLTGDSISANILMLGFAWQSGGVPLSRAAIEQAIHLNGRDVEANLQAFNAGRRAASEPAEAPQATQTLEQFIAKRAGDLTRYWNADYAQRYLDLMQRTCAASGTLEGGEAFGWAMARAAFKLMAYKDEYEVARLYTDGRFHAALANDLEGVRKIRVQLAPPLLSGADPNTGRPRKLNFGGWIFPVLSALAAFKGLREGPLDLFGLTVERRLERKLRDVFLARAEAAIAALNADTLKAAVAFAEAPMQVRGYGAVKAAPAAALLAKLESGEPFAPA